MREAPADEKYEEVRVDIVEEVLEDKAIHVKNISDEVIREEISENPSPTNPKRQKFLDKIKA